MGEIAALITAFCWALSSIFFTHAGKEVGSIVVNRVRTLLAVLLLLCAHLVIYRELLPWSAEPYRWIWLSLSGIVGLALGDSFLFESYIKVGNRIGTLFMASAPVIGGLLAWVFLGETLAWIEIAGIALCIAGIILVVLDRRNGNGGEHSPRAYGLGILNAFLAAACQAGGLILAKKGLDHGFPALSGVLMRMLAALVVLWVIALLRGQAFNTMRIAWSKPQALRNLAAGAFVGPFVGVWFSLIAVQLTHVGVASALMGLTPIIVLPMMRWLYKEEVSIRAVFGTIAALAGATMIILK